MRLRIETGQLKPGASLSERALCDHFGVSRMTARQALKALRDDGLIHTERGLGTFVSENKVNVQTRQLLGFSEDMRQRGFTPSSQVISLTRQLPAQELATQLQIDSSEEVYRIVRLRLADKVPMALESCDIPVKLCPELTKQQIERGSLYKLMEENYGVTIASADEILEAACATRREAKLLELPANAPVLVVQRTVYTADHRPLEVVRSVYRGDRYQATIHLRRKRNR